ncbi:MAG: hypothetical protein AB7H96_06240 [Vicinamibacterales bacterium]
MKKLVQWPSLAWALALVTIGMGARGATAEPIAGRFGAGACQASPGFGQVGSRVAALTGPGGTAGQSATRPTARPAAQVTRNDRADVTFEVRPTVDNSVEVSAVTGDLRVTKRVQGNGEFTLQVATGDDQVTIAMSGRGLNVTRNRKTLDLPRASRDERRSAEARRLLVDSPALTRYRVAADALMETDDRSPAAMALIIADATVGMLTGDVGAPRRIARQLAQRGQRNLRPAGLAIDCFTLMEQRMVEAWNDYLACYISVTNNPFYVFYWEMCAARWTLQVESYWFSFLSCSGFNW